MEPRDELGEVALAFNETAESLEAARRQLLAEAERTLDLERQLRQAETLTVAGKLASSVAHGVGTPLNIVSGRAEQVLRTLPPDDPRRADLGHHPADRALCGILRSLLDTVRLRKPDVGPTSLPAVLDRLMPLLRHAARRHEATLSSSVPTGLPSVLADPNQLQQIVINLVVNALEAMSPGVRVEVTACAREHDEVLGVAVSVSDTGPRIPQDVLPRVFEAFFATKAAGHGSGLGLAVCREIVTQHGGDIGITSQIGLGTTVTVWLPRADVLSTASCAERRLFSPCLTAMPHGVLAVRIRWCGTGARSGPSSCGSPVWRCQCDRGPPLVGGSAAHAPALAGPKPQPDVVPFAAFETVKGPAGA